ncbi:transcription repressor OFP17-like [Typha angustifolia]|uniref:transcription repressor OFP17-like n=1 Tax=Typha angustifolia TaxID=59011 RepID=UPI003C30EA2A
MRPSKRRGSFRSIRAAFLSLISRRTEEEADKIGELPSLTERARAPLSSPVTPAYVKMARHERDDKAEEACRNFENYLTEMLVDERKVRDLMDVEELLLCWSSLNNPVFVELVCRFYAELCNDLFSSDESGAAVDDIISAAT